MLATLNVVVLVLWLLAEVIPAAADRIAAHEAEWRRRRRDR